MTNVHYIPNNDVVRKRIVENETFEYDRRLAAARHELSMLFLQRMTEEHSAADLQRIMQLHDIGNSVIKFDDLPVLEGVIRDLKQMDPNYVPIFRRKYN